MPLAEQIAVYAHRLDYGQLDERTVHEVRRRFIDTFACALGAYHAQVVQVGRRVARRTSGHPGASILGLGERRAAVEHAAFVNGVMFRYLDYNDTYLSLEPAHPSDNIAAVLAAAQFHNATGRDVIAATVLAYEIQCRLCDAAGIRPHGWDHVTYGAFSTAAAAAKLMLGTKEIITQALNLAGTPNVALRQTRAGELSAWKGCAFANASRNGVFAAMLAGEGLTGPAPIFEGEMGFFKQVSGEFDLPLWGGEDGEDFMINRTSIKFWPAEYHSQSAIHAALELRPQLPSIDAIDSIDIFSFDAAVDIIGKDPEKWRPKTRETADHSLPYCTAVALMDGDVTLDSFSPERLSDEPLLDLTAKIQIHRDDELTAKYPQGIPNRIVVTLKDGNTLESECTYPRGHAENPMSDDEVEAKLRRMADALMAEGMLEENPADQILDLCRRLETLPAMDPLFEAFPVTPATLD